MSYDANLNDQAEQKIDTTWQKNALVRTSQH
jgi:hypothetical protein